MSLIILSPKLEAIALEAKCLMAYGESIYNIILFYFILEYKISRKNIFLLIKYLGLFKVSETSIIVDDAIHNRKKAIVKLKYLHKIIFYKRYVKKNCSIPQSLDSYDIDLSGVDFSKHLDGLNLLNKINAHKNDGCALYREILCDFIRSGDQLNIDKLLSLANIEHIKIKTLTHDLYIDKNRRWSKLRCFMRWLDCKLNGVIIH